MKIEELVGKKVSLDLGSQVPVEFIVEGVENYYVDLQYVNSTPGRESTFTIKDFEALSGIKIENANEFREEPDDLKAVADTLKESGKHGLEVEVFRSAMNALKQDPTLSIEQALNCGLYEWDI